MTAQAGCHQNLLSNTKSSSFFNKTPCKYLLSSSLSQLEDWWSSSWSFSFRKWIANCLGITGDFHIQLLFVGPLKLKRQIAWCFFLFHDLKTSGLPVPEQCVFMCWESEQHKTSRVPHLKCASLKNWVTSDCYHLARFSQRLPCNAFHMCFRNKLSSCQKGKYFTAEHGLKAQNILNAITKRERFFYNSKAQHQHSKLTSFFTLWFLMDFYMCL